MIKNRIKILRDKFKKYKIDGYIIPKNDEFFSEYSKINRLKTISNFSGSAGYAVVLKNKNYLFVDGRYTIQAQIESSKNFKIIDYSKIFNCNLFKKLTIGIDAKLFTSNQINNYFLKNNRIKIIDKNLIDEILRKKPRLSKPFFSLSNKIVGESYKSKINKIVKFLNKTKSDYLFVSAPENVAWLLNIRGYDNPNSPIPNTHLILDNKKKIYLICEKQKLKNLLKEKKIKAHQIIEPKNFKKSIYFLKGKKINIDIKTCSIFYESILNKKFKVLKKKKIQYIL